MDTQALAALSPHNSLVPIELEAVQVSRVYLGHDVEENQSALIHLRFFVFGDLQRRGGRDCLLHGR
jgi:hypothetical protein